MLRRRTLPVTAFAQNCSLVWCDRTRAAAVIDPGGDLERIDAAIDAAGVRLEQILLTHAHIDHAGGAGELARRRGVPIVGPHRGDRFWIDAMAEQGRLFGLAGAGPFEPSRWLDDGDSVAVGATTLDVRHCPGHTPGHVVFHDRDSGVAFVGDVLFAGSIGRTDFPGGDHATLLASIGERLWPMGDATVFVPGHGPESTFGDERRTNPFVGGA